MKNILYTLWILLFLFACSESEKVEYSKLSVDFQKSKIDVGENTGILEIPVSLSGYPADIPLQVVVQVSAVDGEAVAGIDYELIDSKLTFNACGQASLKVRIIDNEDITEGTKTFTISIKSDNPEITSKISDLKVYIIDDDSAFKSPLVGHYTLTAQEFGESLKYSSDLGGVEVVQDPVNANKFYFRNLILVNGNNVLPLTMGDELFFLVDSNGGITMPVLQNIGDYGVGEAPGVILGLASDGKPSMKPIKIELKDNQLIFDKTSGLMGVSLEEEEITYIYYALENIILKKANL